MSRDAQITGMAGEFLVAGKLFKRRYQVSITLGNAKGVDLFVQNPKNGKIFSVQVKTQKSKNCFPLKKENIDAEAIYIFVRLNEFNDDEQFYILKGSLILEDIERFYGNSYNILNNPVPAINYGSLYDFENNWELFE